MSDQNFITAAQENTVVNGAFDASVFDVLLLGIYTTVFAQTVYIFATSKKPKEYRVVMGVILLYLLNVAVTGINWFFIRSFLQFTNGEDQFLYASSGPSWIIVVIDVLSLFLSTISNGLFIWRCYNLWNKSRPVISVSMFLLSAQAALFAADTRVDVLDNDNETPALDTASSDLYGAAAWTSFACTLITALLIVYRLHTIPRKERIYNRILKNLLDTFIQSGALLVMASLTFATIMTVSVSTFSSISQFVVISVAASFANSFFPIIFGIAPTIMVAQVMRPSPQTASNMTVNAADLEYQRTDGALG